VSALVLVIASLASEPDTSFLRLDSHGVFGWLGSWHHFGWVLYLSLGPGLAGHTGLNYVVKFIGPVGKLPLSLSLLFLFLFSLLSALSFSLSLLWLLTSPLSFYLFAYINVTQLQVISVALMLEPIIGTFLGWCFGYAEAPGIWTYVGGIITLISTIWVTLAANKRKVETGAKI
jgi:hypothetical protein